MFTIVVQLLSCVRLLRLHGLQNTRLSCPSPSRKVCPNSSLFSRWYHPIVWPSVAAFSSCLQSFLAPGSFATSRLFKTGGQNIGASASASVLPMNIQGWFPLASTGLISLQSKRISRGFSNTTVRKHQFSIAALFTIAKVWKKVSINRSRNKKDIYCWLTKYM